MYENGKMRPVETILRMEGEQDKGECRIKENGGGVSSTMIYSKHFCQCHNVPLV
jgi:hypothetical protein